MEYFFIEKLNFDNLREFFVILHIINNKMNEAIGYITCLIINFEILDYSGCTVQYIGQPTYFVCETFTRVARIELESLQFVSKVDFILKTFCPDSP